MRFSDLIPRRRSRSVHYTFPAATINVNGVDVPTVRRVEFEARTRWVEWLGRNWRVR